MKKLYNRSHNYSFLLSLLLLVIISGASIGQTITRTQILKNALPYTTYEFTATTNNIWSGTNCSALSITVTTPSWVATGTNFSVPYCWGGFSTLSSFTTGIGANKSAGDDDCTGNGDGSESCALGVDCSGFVSRAWGRTSKESTSTLPSISTTYSSPTKVKPGDAFDNVGSHVRLVYKNNGNGTYTVIESSADGWDVAIHTYSTYDLASYTPMYYDNVVNPYDSISPTTAIGVSGSWQTANFTTTFTDKDNTGGSGLEKSYYTVADFNGSKWVANAQRGFITDNFVTLDTSWKVPSSSGTWTVSGGMLVQSDSTVSNTNIYRALNQTLSNRYLYHFKARLTSAEDPSLNRRFGLHFFCEFSQSE